MKKLTREELQKLWETKTWTEICEILEISPATLYRLAKKQQLGPKTRVNNPNKSLAKIMVTEY